MLKNYHQEHSVEEKGSHSTEENLLTIQDLRNIFVDDDSLTFDKMQDQSSETNSSHETSETDAPHQSSETNALHEVSESDAPHQSSESIASHETSETNAPHQSLVHDASETREDTTV